MKVVFALCFLACTAFAMAEQYTNKYDHVNVDEILENKRLFFPYLKCALGTGRCAPEAKELKAHLQEAIENDCAKCTEVQRKNTRKVIGHLINKENNYWQQLVAKYDPSHKYMAKYEAELSALMA